MFTVRHIDSNNHEFVFAASTITSEPPRDSSDRQRIVCARPGEIFNGVFDSGIIYVMNENGRTVAKYDLGPPLVGAEAVEDLSEKFPEGVIRG